MPTQVELLDTLIALPSTEPRVTDWLDPGVLCSLDGLLGPILIAAGLIASFILSGGMAILFSSRLDKSMPTPTSPDFEDNAGQASIPVLAGLAAIAVFLSGIGLVVLGVGLEEDARSRVEAQRYPQVIAARVVARDTCRALAGMGRIPGIDTPSGMSQAEFDKAISWHNHADFAVGEHCSEREMMDIVGYDRHTIA